MAAVFAKVRYTGDVSNDDARFFRHALEQIHAQCQSLGIEVRASVDVRLDPEPVPAPAPVREPEPVRGRRAVAVKSAETKTPVVEVPSENPV